MIPVPYLTFQGDCREAMTAYQKIFGGKLDPFMLASDAPDDYTPPAGKENWVMHVGLQFESGGAIYASDDIMGGTPPMQGMSISMDFPTIDEGRVAFEALADGGEVRMPYQATFWTPGFGTLRDRWGKNWMISTTEPLPEGA